MLLYMNIAYDNAEYIGLLYTDYVLYFSRVTIRTNAHQRL